ncbi:MAG TPA: CDP-alcohol phosphatidyltransferase family protein [Candidatus Limnocylindrales bacterium]|nr:CDP-alcohol phosphatidyltransferase family protein [Candidatus Limnocylindrales bacterium]
MSSIVSPELRSRVRDIAIPIALAFGRLGLTPNALTVIGFGIAVGAAVAATLQAWVLAAVLVIVGGVFDLFDGALARATNRVSRVGAFLDSVFDRAGESMLFIGIAWGSARAGFDTGAILATAAMAASFLVSYTRAKSESLGFTPGTGMANVGLAPREVRLVLVTIGLLLTGLNGGIVAPVTVAGLTDLSWWAGRPVLAGTLALITVLATITSLQRILHVIRQPQPTSEEHE